MTLGTMRINGIRYRVRLTKMRQIVNGQERMTVIDHETQTIRVSSLIREAFIDAAGLLRKSAPISHGKVVR